MGASLDESDPSTLALLCLALCVWVRFRSEESDLGEDLYVFLEKGSEFWGGRSEGEVA
jgi:hypothetical protein